MVLSIVPSAAADAGYNDAVVADVIASLARCS